MVVNILLFFRFYTTGTLGNPATVAAGGHPFPLLEI